MLVSGIAKLTLRSFQSSESNLINVQWWFNTTLELEWLENYLRSIVGLWSLNLQSQSIYNICHFLFQGLLFLAIKQSKMKQWVELNGQH